MNILELNIMISEMEKDYKRDPSYTNKNALDFYVRKRVQLLKEISEKINEGLNSL